MALTEKLTAIADAIRVQSGKADKLTLDQMSGEIMDLQTLNFEVAGNPQPVSPEENTIWVDTDAEITGWIFSAVQPEQPAEGTVWILTGTASDVAFNALKKNGITVCPLSAKQYVGGAWADKTVKSYQGGVWVDWIVYLYNCGDMCEDITGGWSSSGYSGGGVSVTSATYGVDRITFAGASNTHNVACTNNPIDLTGRSKLKFHGAVTADETYSGNTYGINVKVGTSKNFSSRAANMHLKKGTYDGENAVLDISQLSGKYYIAVHAEGLTGISGYMTKLELV